MCLNNDIPRSGSFTLREAGPVFYLFIILCCFCFLVSVVKLFTLPGEFNKVSNGLSLSRLAILYVLCSELVADWAFECVPPPCNTDLYV